MKLEVEPRLSNSERFTGTSTKAWYLFASPSDAAIVVASAESPIVRQLAEEPQLELLDLDRTGAYGRVFPFLTPVTLDEGVLNLGRNIPPRDTRLVATAASLAARADLHAALVPALLNAVTRVHQSGGLLAEAQRFPSASLTDLPMNADATRYIRNGPSSCIAGCRMERRSCSIG